MTNNVPKILITGAGGTVGSLVAGELEGLGPRLAFRSEDKAKAAAAKGRDAVAVDFARPETLSPALAGVDAVFLLGAGLRGQEEGETNVVRAAASAGVKRVVKLSVLGAEQEGYAIAKVHRAVERALEASGLAYTFLRANGFMQNFSNHMGGSIRSQGAIYQPAGDAKISHVDARDIARVAARALTDPAHEGRAYDLTGPEAITYGEAADVLSRAAGRRVRYVPVSDEAAKAGMVGSGMPEFYADALVELYRFYRGGLGAALSPAVREVTGEGPASFDRFVRDYAGSFG